MVQYNFFIDVYMVTTGFILISLMTTPRIESSNQRFEQKQERVHCNQTPAIDIEL